jgi:hypothetical protein
MEQLLVSMLNPITTQETTQTGSRLDSARPTRPSAIGTAITPATARSSTAAGGLRGPDSAKFFLTFLGPQRVPIGRGQP